MLVTVNFDDKFEILVTDHPFTNSIHANVGEHLFWVEIADFDELRLCNSRQSLLTTTVDDFEWHMVKSLIEDRFFLGSYQKD